MGYYEFRLDGFPICGTPQYLRKPQGLAWNAAFGAVEDGFAAQAQGAAQSSFATLAPIDMPGELQALDLIGEDMQLLPPAIDDVNRDAYRAWLQTGMSAGGAGATLPWLPSAATSLGIQIGVNELGTLGTSDAPIYVNGLVWSCTAITTGITGVLFPFPANAQLGQSVVDDGVTWTWSGLTIAQVFSNPSPPAAPTPAPGLPTPIVSNPPGWYYSGTDLGLYNALINSGFFAVDPGGKLIGPALYYNRDWNNVTIGHTGTGTGTFAFTGASLTEQNISANIIVGGEAGGFSGAVSLDSSTRAPWAMDTIYPTGAFVASGHGDVYYASTGGTSGATSPFPASTPPDSTWPPTPGQDFIDGTVNWTLATFATIPLAIPIGGSWGIAFAGLFTTADSYSVDWIPDPPDGRTDAWSRLWLVIPAGLFLNEPLLWGPTGGPPIVPVAGEFSGYWGGPPAGEPFPVDWGATGQITNQSIYGLVSQILNRWCAGHCRVIGAWMVSGYVTAIDTPYPSGRWNEALNITVGGVNPPFFQFNTEL